MKRRNIKGQISSQLSILLTKKLKAELAEKADYCDRQVKNNLRKTLEEYHKSDIYSTYKPNHDSGKTVEEYNKSHKHQKKQPYHHTKTLISSVHGVVDGDTVKIEIDDRTYDDGTSAKDVYEWLDKGTKKSEYDVYILGGKGSHTPYVEYVPQPRHGYKKKTLDRMDSYIKNTLIPDVEKGKYTRKSRKGAK